MLKTRENVGMISTAVAICSGLTTLYTFVERESGRINLWKVALLVTCLFVAIALSLFFYKSIYALLQRAFRVGPEQRPADQAIADPTMKDFARRLDEIKEKNK